MAREHEEPSRDQVLTPSGAVLANHEPAMTPAFCPDVVAALSLLSKMINEGSKLWSPGSK
jgi:hypothetical protein